MSARAIVFLATLLAVTAASAAPDPVMWLWEHAWPKARTAVPPPPAPESAVPKVEAPEIVAPEVETTPLPKPRPKVEAKPKVKPKAVSKPPHPAVRSQRMPTAKECDLMRKYGRTTAKAWSGYPEDQVEQAFRDCRL